VLDEKLSLNLTDSGPGLGKIRKRRWFLWCVILAYMPAMYATLRITQSYKATGVVFVVWIILLCIFATLAACAKCPRCGNYFHMHGMTLLYLRKCLHCQLHINADKK
jgi:hypothetical protein